MPVSAALESRAEGASSSAPVASVTLVNRKQPALSQGVFPGLPADLHGIRRCFPDLWADFLRAHFRNHQHVAVFFGVDERTARDWLSGRHGVNSAPVIFALRSIPGAVAELLEAA